MVKSGDDRENSGSVNGSASLGVFSSICNTELLFVIASIVISLPRIYSSIDLMRNGKCNRSIIPCTSASMMDILRFA